MRPTIEELRARELKNQVGPSMIEPPEVKLSWSSPSGMTCYRIFEAGGDPDRRVIEWCSGEGGAPREGAEWKATGDNVAACYELLRLSEETELLADRLAQDREGEAPVFGPDGRSDERYRNLGTAAAPAGPRFGDRLRRLLAESPAWRGHAFPGIVLRRQELQSEAAAIDADRDALKAESLAALQALHDELVAVWEVGALDLRRRIEEAVRPIIVGDAESESEVLWAKIDDALAEIFGERPQAQHPDREFGR